MSFKQEKVIVIISEFVNDKREFYPITNVPVEKARFFYKDDDGLFKVMASSDYAVRTELNETRLYITNVEIKEKSTKFQVGYEINFTSSEYETSLPVLSVLVEMYNNLIEDSRTIFNYVKKQCFISDDKATSLVLPNLPSYTVWCMGENNEMFALPVSELYSKFGEMLNKLKSILADYTESKKEEISGATYTPYVSPEGIITFTNDKNKPNPEPVNIKGPAGTIENVTASVNSNAGVPSVKVTMSGTKENRSFNLQFENLKGDMPIKGEDYYTPAEKEQFSTEMVGIVKSEGTKVVEQVKSIVSGNPATTNALSLSGKTRIEFEQDTEKVKETLKNELNILERIGILEMSDINLSKFNLSSGYINGLGNFITASPEKDEKTTDYIPLTKSFKSLKLWFDKSDKELWARITLFDENKKFIKAIEILDFYNKESRNIQYAPYIRVSYRNFNNNIKMYLFLESDILKVETDNTICLENQNSKQITDFKYETEKIRTCAEIGKGLKAIRISVNNSKYYLGLQGIDEKTGLRVYDSGWVSNNKVFTNLDDSLKYRVTIKKGNSLEMELEEVKKNISLVCYFTNRELEEKIETTNSNLSSMVFLNNISTTVKTIAHRGNNIDAPQCVKAAYIEARKRGLTIAENDLNISKDGQYVMWHDVDFGRIGHIIDTKGRQMYTDGTIFYWYDEKNKLLYNDDEILIENIDVQNLTQCKGKDYSTKTLNFKTLHKIDLGRYFHIKFAGEQILTFEEWVMLCKQLGMSIYIDTKISYTKEILKELCGIVKKCGMLNNTTWIINSIELSTYFRTLDSNSRIAALTHPNQGNVKTWESIRDGGRGFVFNGDGKTATKENIQLGLENGYEVEVWYVDFINNKEEVLKKIQELVSFGITGLTTDKYRVDEAFEYLIK